MAFVGFSFTNPIAVMSMVDPVRWRPVVYADTPRVLAQYMKFMSEVEGDGRKSVLLLLGASSLHRVAKDYDRFDSIFVFDDLQNLHTLKRSTEGFEVVDVEVEDGIPTPRHLTPAEMNETVALPSPASPFPLAAKLTAALGKRRPSVLESTSRMPIPEVAPVSGAQRMMAEVKRILDETESPLPFSIVIDAYIRFLFRITTRLKVTSAVTKKLPDEAKDIWSTALDLAGSDVGLTMARAYRKLCENEDVDYRVGQAVNEFNLKLYSGDFLYFTAIFPPHRNCVFISELPPEDELSAPKKRRFKSKPAKAKAKKKTQKKA